LLETQLSDVTGTITRCIEALKTQDDKIQSLESVPDIDRMLQTLLKRENIRLTKKLGEVEDDKAELEREKAVLQSKAYEARLEVARLNKKLLEAEKERAADEKRCKRVQEMMWDDKRQAYLGKLGEKDDLGESLKKQLRETASAQELLNRAQALVDKMEPTVAQKLEDFKAQRAVVEIESDTMRKAIEEKRARVQWLQARLEQIKRESPKLQDSIQSPGSPDLTNVQEEVGDTGALAVQHTKTERFRRGIHGFRGPENHDHTGEGELAVGSRSLGPPISIKPLVRGQPSPESQDVAKGEVEDRHDQAADDALGEESEKATDEVASQLEGVQRGMAEFYEFLRTLEASRDGGFHDER
jgi:hypothetical protein